MNPYSPPKAPVGDVTGPPPLPRGVRVVRGLAVAGNAVVALTVVLLLMVLPGGTRILVQFLVYVLCVAFYVAVHIVALTTRPAPRLAFWGALLSSCAVLAFFVYVHFARPPRNGWAVLIYIVPALLNLAALISVRAPWRSPRK